VLVALDTNVVVSSVLSPKGPPGRIVDLWRTEKIDLIVSEPILEEYARALSYEKVRKVHRKTDEEIEQLILDFREFARVEPDPASVDVELSDPADRKLLDVAIAGPADLIISGDPHLLSLREFRGIPIVSPRVFLDVVASEHLA
jgi:putative PIN family toxin of toxin-antitoxin system